ncbi:MAG: hypothetical protein M0R80_08230 [Proteobacteria bacterium]|jgi:hypothetical protein|nr:hypothetical protein [Pseudomonadota bacterium]
MKPLVCWKSLGNDSWGLYVGRGKNPRLVANVWNNGVWHTWDHNGVGGENSKEESVKKAMIEAAASVISQGFI